MECRNLTTVDEYARYIGEEAVQRLKDRAAPLRDARITHVNSTYYGGGVSQILSSLTLLMNSVGVKAEWRVIHGPPEFFNVTKKLHNALQGAEINLTDRKKEIYERVVYENSIVNHLDTATIDTVFIHDPQPLPLVGCYKKKCPWVWRCHIDLSTPNREAWEYLKQFVEKYDAAIFTLREYAKDISIPQLFFMPAIDPFTTTNKDLPEDEIQERLDYYHIPSDLPIVTQISRFDPWKDPQGVIEAANIARKETPFTLVLLGNIALDDPEGKIIFESLLKYQNERTLILVAEDSALVNALQRRSAVVLQKSIREGFGLTVAEAMWKGTPVIGGNVGGIRYQIDDGVNGFLVNSPEEAAEKIVVLLKDKYRRNEMGVKAREKVRGNFLMTRLLDQYLELIGSWETTFKLENTRQPVAAGNRGNPH